MEFDASTTAQSSSSERIMTPIPKFESSPSYKCQICKMEYEKTMADPAGSVSVSKSPKIATVGENECKMYRISEYIFCYFSPAPKAEHRRQKENIFNALLQIKEIFDNSNIKLYCLTETCPEAFNLCDSTMTVLIDLAHPPKLNSILVVCESIFDWIAKADNNRVLLYCQDSICILALMVYSYSCFYDALLHRDMRLSLELKTFISNNMKYMEQVPVSYRRYGGYMSLYSCMNQLQSLRTSVYLYCLILHNFPLMESNRDRCSQLFFKVYTGDPLACCHTTKLYCLSVSVNRLVILFDKYPISLNQDTMIVCYHRHLSRSKRTKIFRLNFHTCQAISDMLTYFCQDFEDLYKGCTVKMKLDLHFRETAVFSEDQCSFVVETSHTDLSSVERADSYTSLEGGDSFCETGSTTIIKNTQSRSVKTTNFTSETVSNDRVSVTTSKEAVTDHINRDVSSQLDNSSSDVLNQSGRISGPIDSHHSTKLDSVRTSSTVLNGSEPRTIDLNSKTSSFGSNSYQARTSASVDREKCNKQLDSLMKDLSLERTFSSNPSRMGSNGYAQPRDNHMASSVQQMSSTNSSREIQLMTELLEAQKEISNLRRSMNNLDLTDQPSRGFSSTPSNGEFHSPNKFKGFSKGSIGGSSPDSYHYSTPRTQKWTRTEIDSNSVNNEFFKRNLGRNKTQPTSYSVETQSVNEFQETRPSGYSAHRENMELDRILKENNSTTERTAYQNQTKEREMSDVFEEIETINLQPIGKGIQDLAVRASPNKITMKETRNLESTGHAFPEDVGSLSPIIGRQPLLSNRTEGYGASRFHSDIHTSLATINSGTNQPNINLQYVEERIQSWYQPHISRDEAIAILRNCTPGSFLIRDSNTYSGAYGLAIKVASIPQNITLKSDDLESEKVRHYLIEQIGNQGICFKGFPEEPIFSTLSQLVLYYTQTTSVLPCQLKIADRPFMQLDVNRQNKMSASNHSVFTTSPKVSTSRKNDSMTSEFLVYYLGCYDVEFITGPSVINKAVERLLENIDTRRYTECQLRINPGEGIVLTDLERKLFFRRNHPFSTIIYCATDPRDRKVELDLCKSRGIKKTKLFGMIIRAYIAGENKCFLFGELDPYYKASAIVKSITQHIQKPHDP